MPHSEKQPTHPWDSLKPPPHLFFDPGLPDRDVLRTPGSPRSVDTEWDTLVSGIELIEQKTQKTLKDLIATIPESVQKTIRSVKDRYAYREYSVDGRRCQYMGMKAEWNQETEEISNITLHLKNGTEEYTLELASSKNGEYILFIAPKQGIVSIKELTDPMKPIELLTSLGGDQVDRMAPKKPRKTISKFRTRVGNYPPPPTSVPRDDKVEVPEAIQESSEQILKDHFPQFEQRIAEVDVLKVYGRKVQDGTYEMVFDIKESSVNIKEKSSLIIRKENNGGYAVSAGTSDRVFDYHNKTNINIGKIRERRILFDEKSKSISLPLSERQSVIDDNPGAGLSFHPYTENNLVWKNQTVTIAQAKAIGGFHDLEFDFGGRRSRQKLIATKNKDSNDLWLQRVDSTESDYFVVIVKENGEVVSSISRNSATRFISTAATLQEQVIIDRIRKATLK